MLNKLNKIKFIHIFWVFFYILIFSLLLKGGFSYLDPDMGWHLRVGKEIALSAEVPKTNHFNFTYTGSWVDHEWLSNYLMYQVNSKFGYVALVSVFALIILLTLIILNIFVRKSFGKKIPFFVIAILQLFGVIASMPHFGVRIQELSLLFLLILLIILHKYSEKKNSKYLLALIPLFFLWASLHASFLLGLALLLAYLLIKLIEPWFKKKDKYLYWLDKSRLLNFKQVSIFAGFSFLSLVATFLTPYRLELYSFLSDYRNSAYLSLISEWLPQHNFPFYYGQLLYMALALSALIILGYLALSRQKKIDSWYLFLSILFLFLSWMSRRHFPLFFIASFPLLASFYADFFQDIKLRDYSKYLSALTLTCLFLVASIQFLQLRPVHKPFESFCNSYPCAALNFLKTNEEYLEGNLFNIYGWGGYLNYTLQDKEIFIDGRLPQVPFEGHTFVEEYYNFLKKETDKESLLLKHNIDTVLIPAANTKIKVSKWEQIFFNIKKSDLVYENYLRDYLQASDKWDLVYSDKVSHIYYRIKHETDG